VPLALKGKLESKLFSAVQVVKSLVVELLPAPDQSRFAVGEGDTGLLQYLGGLVETTFEFLDIRVCGCLSLTICQQGVTLPRMKWRGSTPLLQDVSFLLSRWQRCSPGDTTAETSRGLVGSKVMLVLEGQECERVNYITNCSYLATHLLLVRFMSPLFYARHRNKRDGML
jgi:hypothetical protein